MRFDDVYYCSIFIHLMRGKKSKIEKWAFKYIKNADSTAMKKSFLILFIILMSCGVKEKEFNKATWNNRKDIFYVNREIMVKDLMENHLSIGMSYYELIEIIGKPDFFGDLAENKLGYEIFVDYGWDIDPIKGSNLLIELSKDSTVVNYKLESWEY